MPQQEDILLARQPILDRSRRLRGYELLARDARGLVPQGQSGHVTTCQVLVQVLTDFGLEPVVGELPAWINLTREFLVGEVPLPLSPKHVVLEVLESVEPDPEVLRGIRKLKRAGFTIALDDYVGSRAGYHEMLALADIVKVDCLGREPDEIGRIVQTLRPFGLRMLAEKVERQAEFELYEQLGFELFQGYFFVRPDTLRGRARSVNRINLVRLLAELQDPEATPEDLELIITRDPALSLKLVRFLNSAQFGLRRRIDALREVVAYLGSETVRNVACLLMLSGVDDKPRQLMVTAMMRARMCEVLANATNGAGQRAFTVGLFSTLDALMDQELHDVVSSLPLHEDIRSALIDHSGALGTQLESVLAYERGEFDQLQTTGSKPEDMVKAFREAVGWVASVERELAMLG